jgi:uncharacterized GH25 family protein
MTSILRSCTACLCLLAIASQPVTAHEYWLTPSKWHAGPGDTVEVRAFVGTGFRGENKPYAVTRVQRFEMRAARRLDLRRVAVNGDPVLMRTVLPDAGGMLVALESNFAFIELDAARFDAYLGLEGLDAPLAARQRAREAAGPNAAAPAGRERYARCCKTWVAGEDRRRVVEPVGTTYEIVPLADPLAGNELPVRVLYHGKPLAGALVRAWNYTNAGTNPATRDSVGATFETRTDADGRATLRIGSSGEWLISSVHMVPCTDPEADWESWWASLTFAGPAAATPPAAAAPRVKTASHAP